MASLALKILLSRIVMYSSFSDGTSMNFNVIACKNDHFY